MNHDKAARNDRKHDRHTANGSHAFGDSRGALFAKSAKRFVSSLPVNLEDELKKRPYRVLGIACAAGVGIGVVLGSRILRGSIASIAAMALVEFARSYLREQGETAFTNTSDQS